MTMLGKKRSRFCLPATWVAIGGMCVSACRAPAVQAGPGGAAAQSFAGLASSALRSAAVQYVASSGGSTANSPIALTASDGTGLRLTRLTAKGVVEGPLAFTELHMTFYNPESRVREGRFNIVLPPEAAISRFAMKLARGWQEAEVVERQKARQVYEDFLHRRQDPALLEKQAGNRFRARIFPIPARSSKEIIVSYSQNLASAKSPYRIYLKGLPKIDALDIAVTVGETTKASAGASSLGGESIASRIVRVRKRGFTPDRDFSVVPERSPDGLLHGRLAAVRFRPRLSNARAAISKLVLLVDTSASRAPGFSKNVAKLGRILAELVKRYGKGLSLQVACFDQDVASVFEGKLGDFGAKQRQAILARRPLGASDLARALRWAGKRARDARVLLLTDGVVTAGQSGLKLKQAAQGLRAHRLDVLLQGGIRDRAAMKTLVRGAAAVDGTILDGANTAEAIAERLSRRTLSKVTLEVPGAKWIWPRRLDGLQAGDDVLLFADLEPAHRTRKSLRVRLAGALKQQHDVRLVSVAEPLLQRAWVQARIAYLQQQRDSGSLDPDMRGALTQQMTALSLKHRVLTDTTALLVLESERDYARYGIARRALADILVVGQGGVETLARSQPVLQVARPATTRPRRKARPRVRTERARRRADRPARKSTRSFGRAPSGALRGLAGDGGARTGSGGAPAAMEAEAPAAEARGMAARPGQDQVEGSMAQPEANYIGRRRRRGGSGRPQVVARPPRQLRQVARADDDRREAKQSQKPALRGRLARITRQIKRGQRQAALLAAMRWQRKAPGDVLALVALGDALKANNQRVLAARAYGSIIDLFPSRADLRRFAGGRLEALGNIGLRLAVETYRQAVKQRPDHASGYHVLAMALLRQGREAEAFELLSRGLRQRYRIRKPGVLQILREDLSLVAAVWLRKAPKRAAEIEARLRKLGVEAAARAGMRFVLTWETDANDVDFHIYDRRGGHASYRKKTLASGGRLYADVTNGYGPECFAIEGRPKAFPYRLKAHYYSRGPMGYGMGQLQILRHDGRGRIRFENRPFLVMNEHAYVDLGRVYR